LLSHILGLEYFFFYLVCNIYFRLFSTKKIILDYLLYFRILIKLFLDKRKNMLNKNRVTNIKVIRADNSNKIVKTFFVGEE